MNKIIEEDLQYITNSTIVDWNKFTDKTVLITGANGMIASYLVKTLLYLNKTMLKDNPCKVIALVNKNINRLEEVENDDNLTLFFINVNDLTNGASSYFERTKTDFIIHASSLASPKYYNINPVEVILPNVVGTYNTLEIARNHNIEGYLFLSAGEIYGKGIDGRNLEETSYGYIDPLDIRSCYGESKKQGENLCIAYGHQYSVPVKIARLFHTYGAGMDLEGGRVFEDFVKNIINNEDIVINSDGTDERQFCYISDAVIALFLILLEGENNNAYNVATEESTSIRKLALVLINMYSSKKLKLVFKKPENYLKSPVKKYSPDVTKINELGWKAEISLHGGFKRTIESFDTNK